VGTSTRSTGARSAACRGWGRHSCGCPGFGLVDVPRGAACWADRSDQRGRPRVRRVRRARAADSGRLAADPATCAAC